MGKTPPDALKTVDTTRIPPEGTWHTMFAREIYRQRRDDLYRYRRFGGVRIEDVVGITAHGARVLGPDIPKAAATVEAACS